MENSNEIIAEIKDKKITKRIGTFTFGITLILFGIIVIIQTFTPFDLLKFVLMLWPIIFISIGSETLYYLWKKEIQIKYDFLGIILTLFLVFIGGLFSIGNYAVNKVLYNPEVQNNIVELVNNNPYRLSYNNKCSISNLSGKNVNIQIVESSEIENIIYFSNNLAKNADTIEAILSQSRYDHLYISRDKDYSLNICITQLPDYIDSIDILVYTNNKDSITIQNCTLI